MFSRTYDMFGFFRAPSEAPGRINPNYWAEKLRHGLGSAIRSAKNFSIDVLKRQAKDCLDNYELTPRERNEIEAELDALLDGYTDRDEHEALNALLNFRQGQVHFDSCDGPFGLEWSYHYLWCLHAIVWAIDRWDARDTR